MRSPAAQLKTVLHQPMEANMSTSLSREDKLRDAFLVLGSQYFAHARYSAQIFYLPVSATLFHHSIEMLLKGYLIKFMKLDELKKIGHNLEKLWDEFKVLASRSDLVKYDQSIKRHLDTVPYPDVISAVLSRKYVIIYIHSKVQVIFIVTGIDFSR